MTMLISVASLLVSNLLIWPIGIRAAVHQYGWFDNAFSALSFFAMAIPSFMVALILMYIAYEFFDSSPGGLFSPEFANAAWSFAKLKDLLAHLWIPIVILGLGSVGGGVRSVRANLLDQLRMPYVLTARAKGVPERRLILKYPLRMAANPFICSIGWLLPGLVGGEVIVSTVLGIPTTGPILLEGIMNQDMYVAGAIVMLLSVLTVVGTLISDILLALLDPRIRYE
jgi:peptide/nickel transport system permease protein